MRAPPAGFGRGQAAVLLEPADEIAALDDILISV